MAELAASAFAAMAIGGAETAIAGTAAAGAAGAGLASPIVAAAPGMAAGSTALSAVQSGFSVMSAISTVLGGVAGYNSHNNQAAFADLEAENERLGAEAEALRIRREMVKRVGDARVAYAASGQDVSGAGEVVDSLYSQAAFETAMARSGGAMRAAGRGAQADSLRSQGTASLISAAGKTADRGLDTYLDVRKRR